MTSRRRAHRLGCLADTRAWAILPVSAPRQVRRDVYNPSLHVQKYRAYQGEVILRRVALPLPYYHLVFVMPMAASWSTRKQAAMHGMPHQQKPDKDNLEKALLDSLFGDTAGDAHVWDGRVSKLWGTRPLIITSDVDLPVQLLPFDLEPYYRMAPAQK